MCHPPVKVATTVIAKDIRATTNPKRIPAFPRYGPILYPMKNRHRDAITADTNNASFMSGMRRRHIANGTMVRDVTRNATTALCNNSLLLRL